MKGVRKRHKRILHGSRVDIRPADAVRHAFSADQRVEILPSTGGLLSIRSNCRR